MNRETGETNISLTIDIDGRGEYDVDTGSGMFDHLLSAMSKHGLIDLNLHARGDTHVGWHHLVEDVGILLGRALGEASGDGTGIARMGHSYVPLDETLALTVVDFGGRGYSVIDLPITDSDLGGLPGDLIRHFLESLAREGRFNLHVRLLAGENNHHKAEAVFKSLGRSLRMALSVDERLEGDSTSTKGVIG